MQNPEDPPATVRLLNPPGSLTSDSAEGAQAVCEGCNWRVTQTRRFRGRMLCLPCIGEYFEAEGEEDDGQ